MFPRRLPPVLKGCGPGTRRIASRKSLGGADVMEQFRRYPRIHGTIFLCQYTAVLLNRFPRSLGWSYDMVVAYATDRHCTINGDQHKSSDLPVDQNLSQNENLDLYLNVCLNYNANLDLNANVKMKVYLHVTLDKSLTVCAFECSLF